MTYELNGQAVEMPDVIYNRLFLKPQTWDEFAKQKLEEYIEYEAIASRSTSILGPIFIDNGPMNKIYYSQEALNLNQTWGQGAYHATN